MKKIEHIVLTMEIVSFFSFKVLGRRPSSLESFVKKRKEKSIRENKEKKRKIDWAKGEARDVNARSLCHSKLYISLRLVALVKNE